MPFLTYDTPVCISRYLTDFQKLPQNFRLSAIVMMELMAGDLDESLRKFRAEIFSRYQQKDLLIVPTADDWLFAAKVLHLLTHTRKRLQKGRRRVIRGSLCGLKAHLRETLAGLFDHFARAAD